MKKTRLFPLFVLISFLSSAFIWPSPTLIGKWKGKSGGEIGMITFDKEGYVSFTTEGEEVGGKKYVMDGIVFDMTYETNESVNPHTMDFVITMREEKIEVGRLTGIFKFVNDKTLILNMNMDGTDRPSLFDPEDPNQILLHRVK